MKIEEVKTMIRSYQRLKEKPNKSQSNIDSMKMMMLDMPAAAKLLLNENEKLKEALGSHRWIPVTERLPKSPTDYLCCDMKEDSTERPAVFVANTWSKADGFWQGGVQLKVTHWKPILLPELKKILEGGE